MFYFYVYSNVEVLTTLTTDVGRILSKLHQVQPKGNIKFCTGVKVAHVSRDTNIIKCIIAPPIGALINGWAD